MSHEIDFGCLPELTTEVFCLPTIVPTTPNPSQLWKVEHLYVTKRGAVKPLSEHVHVSHSLRKITGLRIGLPTLTSGWPIFELLILATLRSTIDFVNERTSPKSFGFYYTPSSDLLSGVEQ
jgi:hypothetical protein